MRRGNPRRGRVTFAVVATTMLLLGFTACRGPSTTAVPSRQPNILRPYRGFDSWISFNGREPWRRLAARVSDQE